MEIRVSVDDKFAKQLQEKLGTTKATDIAKSALTLLNWAADEVSQGRLILSSDSDGENLHRLVMPDLEVAKRSAPEGTTHRKAKGELVHTLEKELRQALESGGDIEKVGARQKEVANEESIKGRAC